MRRPNDLPKRFLATFLAVILAYSNTPAQIAMGLEAVTGSADAAAGTSSLTGNNLGDEKPVKVEAASEAGAGDEQATVSDQPAEITSGDEESPAASSDDEEGAEVAPTAESDSLYSIEATFGDVELTENTTISEAWTTCSKVLNVKLSRNTGLTPAAGKQYVLCMKVPDTLYFNGTPKASDINGVEDVAMIQNAKPTIHDEYGKESAYALNAYSGEIRMLLNTAVENVTVADLGVTFDPQLVGYRAVSDTNILEALDIRVVEVSQDESLKSFDATKAETIDYRQISSLAVNNKAASTTGLRMQLSTDGFNDNYVVNGNVKISRSGSIAYGLSPSAAFRQVYSVFKVRLNCPYIVVDGEKHWLYFDPNDIALKENRQGGRTGCMMTGDAVYDPNAHTITYTFSNISLGSYNVFLYTPNFYWPQELGSDVVVPNSGYSVKIDSWDVVEQKTYAGTDTSFYSNWKPVAEATYYPESVKVTLQSSREAGGKLLATHDVYKGVTPDSGFTGALGFFDLHNEGVTNSPKVKITFDFNTNSNSKAKYYVTKVNIPCDGNTDGTTVNYTLVNADGSEKKEGSRRYDNRTSFTCTVDQLKSSSGLTGTYYIEKISYESATIMQGAMYHTDLAHTYRNGQSEQGQFFGSMTGDVGATAEATMTIESSEGATLYTGEDKPKIVSTEKTSISDNDFVGMGYIANTFKIDGNNTQNITAGSQATVTFSTYASGDEYHGYDEDGARINSVNAYHVVRNPVVYICLPKDVSILGEKQASLYLPSNNKKTLTATKVERLSGSECTYDGVDAYWWAIHFDGANAHSTNMNFTITLSTALTMPGVNWNFEKALAVRADGQSLTWTSQTSIGSAAINWVSGDTAGLSGITSNKDVTGGLLGQADARLYALGAALENDQYAYNKLGLFYYTYGTNTILNIARAEAKLDVDTKLSLDGATAAAGESIKVNDAKAVVDYRVTVSSTDGGTAKDFAYYIPIARTDSAIDKQSFVSEKDFSLKLLGEVDIDGKNADGGALTDKPFEVLYTTTTGLDSTTVRAEDVSWVRASELTDFSAVTAIKIKTKDAADGEEAKTVWPNSSFTFDLKLEYDNSANDFGSQAGREVAWRTFGHYTYERNGSPTTNTYPSDTNSIKLGYAGSVSMDVTLNTGADSNEASASVNLGQAFKNAQTLRIKKVDVSTGTTLVTEDPTNYAGSDANSKFRMSFDVNGSSAVTLTSGTPSGSWNIVSNGSVVFNTKVKFSQALTDASTPRSIDVTLGNDDVTLTVRINLVREVKAVSVAGSGLALGENYLVPSVKDENITIANNSAFTAIYSFDGFVPLNFSAQKLIWKRGGVETALPSGATITMVELSDNDLPVAQWLWRAGGSSASLDLAEFTKMGASGTHFSYDKSESVPTKLKYMFVVNFGGASATNGSYSLEFVGTPISGSSATATKSLDVTMVDPASYALSAKGSEIEWTVTSSAGNESYLDGRSLSLVLTPAAGVNLPADAWIEAGGASYTRNAEGNFVLPAGTVASGSKALTLKTATPDAGEYEFDVSLRLVGSNVDASPMLGKQVDATRVTLGIASAESPSVKVTGTRVAKKSEWAAGQRFAFSVDGLPEGGYVTLAAYEGLVNGAKQTDLLSDVPGFSLAEDGSQRAFASASGNLKLSSIAAAGTYRLEFTVRDANGKEVMTVPYYIVVRE